jgi:hypothetical protein
MLESSVVTAATCLGHPSFSGLKESEHQLFNMVMCVVPEQPWKAPEAQKPNSVQDPW